mmetsp:Transcript_1917/g.5377  ORF Transcript_1917/g.5377 Transcript_1917/m.5377 type:complete len:105 (-) Transcript_1917:129-443(-)
MRRSSMRFFLNRFDQGRFNIHGIFFQYRCPDAFSKGVGRTGIMFLIFVQDDCILRICHCYILNFSRWNHGMIVVVMVVMRDFRGIVRSGGSGTLFIALFVTAGI